MALAGLLDHDHDHDHDHGQVREAMACGQVSEERAVVIVKGVEALPGEHRRDAEAHLIGLAAEHAPDRAQALRGPDPRGRRPRDRRSTRAQGPRTPEALAEEPSRFTISDDGHGQCHGRFTLPSHVGAILKQAVLAINSPKPEAV